MTTLEAIKKRHSVRNYLNRKIDEELVAKLQSEIDTCNQESGLHIQMVIDEPKAFGGFMAHYGKFSGVQNYIALVGRKSDDLDEKIGYYGERLALAAQTLGLNTCWVALTFGKGVAKSRCQIDKGEKLVCVLTLGYGQTQGVAHKSKDMKNLCRATGEMPKWFLNGMEAAMMAPTATNQQKFFISLNGTRVSAKAAGGFYSKVDLGIVKYHFEIGAGVDNFKWV